jgi:hypothetical protein
MGTPTKSLHPRVPADLHQAVTDYAIRTHRTVTGAVTYLIEVGLRVETQRQSTIDRELHIQTELERIATKESLALEHDTAVAGVRDALTNITEETTE